MEFKGKNIYLKKLPDDMNSIVSKFVGLPVHPTARIMKTKIIDFLEQNEQTFRG